MTQPNTFSKSNLIYIPLSITIAHTLNFIVNSSSSIWREFPSKLPNSVYSSILYIPLLLFISLTFKPVRTRKRFYTLLSLALIFISIPLCFRKYPSDVQISSSLTAILFGLKMLLFLKFNKMYLDKKKSDQEKEFKSYLWTLFNWRPDSYIIPPQSKNSNEKEISLIIKSPTTSQVNKKLFSRLILIVVKWLIYELAYFISTKYEIEISENEDVYQIRLMKFITKGILPITMTSTLQYLNYLVLAYANISLNHDIFTIIAIIIFRIFYFTSEKSNQEPILIRLGILTPSEYDSTNEWLITFIFNTKHVFNEPWKSSSPREFWSVRWQLLFNEMFKEFGYLPVKNSFISIVPRNVANMMGVLGGFGVSALLHQYLSIAQFDNWNGEHFFFFIMHGVIFILWEVVFGYEDQNENIRIKIFLKRVLFVIINLLLLPAFVIPMRNQYRYMPSYFTNSKLD